MTTPSKSVSSDNPGKSVPQTNIPSLRFPEFEGEWDIERLGELLSITSSSRVHKDEWTENGVPFFRSSDVVARFKGKNNTEAFISFDLYNALSNKIGRVKKDDILVTGGGSIGIPYLVKDDEPLYFKDADLLWIKKTNSINGYFLYSFFLSPSFREYIKRISHVGTIAHYTVVQVKNTPFQFPSLPEQQKIASFLTAIDTKIEQLTKKKSLLEQYKKGVMQRIFPPAGEQVPQIRFKPSPNDPAYSAGRYPDWEERKFSEIYTFYTTNSLSRDKLNYEEGKVLNIHYGDIHVKFSPLFNVNLEDVPFIKNEIDLTKVKKENYCQEGDLVIADASEDYNDIGKTIEIISLNSKKVLAGLHTFLARPNKMKMAKGFVGQMLKIWEVRKQIMRIAQGTKVLSLSTGRLGEVILNIPCFEEQTKIANFLSGIDNKIDLVNTQLENTQQFKKGLLQQMFV